MRPVRAPGLAQRWLRALGPGVTTGAADDDPSGIATYSVAGAQFGTSFLWTALLTWPLMAAVQMMCARIGMVTGRGLAAALRQRFPLWLVAVASLALLAANLINIAADLSGMADAAQMLGLGPARLYVWVIGIGICIATVWLHYAQIARTLKWLALVLFAYVLAAFLVHPHWIAVLHDTVRPPPFHGSAGWATLVAILGTTISPYLFYWQAGQEIEEEKELGQRTVAQRRGASTRELRARRLDVGTGTFFSNLVMFFIILTTALTLHTHGLGGIQTTRDAAQALRPLAGEYAYLLYTLGILGTGLLAIPTLAGSAAYALAETFDWRYGMNEPLHHARAFYGVYALATVGGAALTFCHVSAIHALVWSAVVNGVLAPFLLLGVLLIASDPTTMGGQPSPPLARAVVALTTLLMFAAAIGMAVF